MQKPNRSPIHTGHWAIPKGDDIEGPKDWEDFSRDQFISIIRSKDPYSAANDTLSKQSYKEAHELLRIAIEEFVISNAAIPRVSIFMCKALFSSTDNQALGLPMSSLRALPSTGSQSCT
jgi:hypothetical protein